MCENKVFKFKLLLGNDLQKKHGWVNEGKNDLYNLNTKDVENFIDLWVGF